MILGAGEVGRDWEREGDASVCVRACVWVGVCVCVGGGGGVRVCVWGGGVRACVRSLYVTHY